MDKRDLKKLTKAQLIRLLLKQQAQKPSNSAKQMVNDCEDIIQSPEQFRDGYKPIPKPRTDRPLQMQNARRPPKPQRSPPPPKREPSSKIKELSRALKGHAKSYEVEIQDNLNLLNHFTKTKALVESHLKDLLKAMKGFKFIETLDITFKKEMINPKIGELEYIYKIAYFNSKAKTITNANEIGSELSISQQEILNTIDIWLSEGSGWTTDKIDSNYINIVVCQSLHGSNYIDLPDELKNSAKGLINIENKDDECFRWCHIRHLNPQKKDPQRRKRDDKQYVDELNYTGITFPVSQKQYQKIEKQSSIKINVFGYEERQPYPIHISKETFEDQMNLLLITEGEKKHYVLIRDFNRFMYNQSKHQHRKHFCLSCLQCFSSKNVLEKHTTTCLIINDKQAINMPKEGESILKFNNHYSQQRVAFVIYADFEAITKKVQGCRPNSNKSYTKAYQTHKDCGYGYKVVCCYDDKYSKPVKVYRGKNAVYRFLEMLKEVEHCKKVVKTKFNKPLIMTENEANFEVMNHCHICGSKYTDKDLRVRDHCHITGKFRGSAHQECNLKLRIKPEDIKVPVIFHNLRGYHSYLFHNATDWRNS